MINDLKAKYRMYKIKNILRKQGSDPDEIEQKITIARLRSHLKLFGHPIDDMTDQEILDAMSSIKRIMSKAGISIDEFYTNLLDASKVFGPTTDREGE